MGGTGGASVLAWFRCGLLTGGYG